MSTLLPDKKATRSLVAVGSVVYLAATVAELTGHLPPGAADAAAAAVQSIDWAAVLDATQGGGLAVIALGFRRLGGQILLALKNPAI